MEEFTLIYTKHPSVKSHIQLGHFKAILVGKGGGGILNETISCCLIEASESKHSVDSFILSISEGSSVINDLYRYLTILYISW